MSKNTIDKAQIQQSFASKIWQKMKDRFHKIHDHSLSDMAAQSIHHDLSLLEEDINSTSTQTAKTEEKDEIEVEITLEELQSALSLLEEQNKSLMNADDAIKELINTLKKSEKNPQDNKSRNSAVEVVVEFIPLSTSASQPTKTVYRELRADDVTEKLKREKEQRELAKKITHYPPSDRLH